MNFHDDSLSLCGENIMLARLQQFTTFALLAAAATCTTLLALQGKFVLALSAFAVITFFHAGVLAIEFVLLAVANRGDPAPQATPRQLVIAWWTEVLSTAQVFYWQQPFRSQRQPDHLPSNARGKVGIVFVHGLVCNRGFWNPWLKRLRQLDVPFVAVNLEPVVSSIDSYSPIVEQAVRQMTLTTANPPLIVAHSMGGLVVRAWLCAGRSEPQVGRVLTLGTPHRGTLLALLALGINARQMRVRSQWLRSLEQREVDVNHSRFTCYYSHCDNIVFPATNATLPGADNRHIPGVAHVQLGQQEEVFREVLRLVRISGN